MDGMTSVAQRLTVEQFFELPDERWTSLVDGDVVVNPPRPLHQLVGQELVFALTLWRRARPGCGESLTSPLLPGFELALDELFGPAAA